jgi:hypothetical protein
MRSQKDLIRAQNNELREFRLKARELADFDELEHLPPPVAKTPTIGELFSNELSAGVVELLNSSSGDSQNPDDTDNPNATLNNALKAFGGHGDQQNFSIGTETFSEQSRPMFEISSHAIPS